MNTFKLILLVAGASLGVAACDQDDGLAEQAGKSMDKTADKIERSATDAGNAIEDACEDMKAGVDAEDPDC